MMAVAAPARAAPDPPVGDEPRHGRVLIVDDSAVARAVLSRVIDASGRWTVSHAVPTVDAALAFLAVEAVDIVLLDLQMPGIDGLTALPALTSAAPAARVIVVSTRAAARDEVLAAGAAAMVTKPGPASYSLRFEQELLATLAGPGASGSVAEPARLDKAARVAEPSPPSPAVPVAPFGRGEFDLVAIGASTGGIHALSDLVRVLPIGCTVPILITQHLPPSFMPYFAAQLAALAGRPCDVAVDRLRVRPGRIVVAPGDAHLHCVSLPDGGTAIRLSRDPVANGCLPSVDPMFASLAAIHGSRLLAVMLSGMGRDGVEGARKVHAAGGRLIVQDQASSVVWGMPGAVAAAGIAAAVMPPEAIGTLIASGLMPR